MEAFDEEEPLLFDLLSLPGEFWTSYSIMLNTFSGCLLEVMMVVDACCSRYICGDELCLHPTCSRLEPSVGGAHCMAKLIR